MTKKERRLIGKASVTAASSVAGGFRTGKRRRGNSLLRKQPVTVRTANLTRDDIARTLESAPDAQAHVNARGVVKRLDYRA